MLVCSPVAILMEFHENVGLLYRRYFNIIS